MGPSRARWAGGALVAVLAVGLLLPVVAMASRPEGGGGGGVLLGADPARLILDVATYLFIVFVLLGLLVIVWALWPRPDEEMPPLPPRRRMALSTVLTVLLALAIALWLRNGRAGRPADFGVGGFGGGRPVPDLTAPVRAAPAGFDWLAAAIVVVLLVAGALLAWWRLWPGRRGPDGRPLARLRAILDDAIEDVLSEADPRRAVILAWARLERVMARHGVPRRESETPFEYAARAGADLGVQPVGLERMAGLFEWARFSTHDVTPAMREEALGGLVAVRDGLRLAAT